MSPQPASHSCNWSSVRFMLALLMLCAAISILAIMLLYLCACCMHYNSGEGHVRHVQGARRSKGEGPASASQRAHLADEHHAQGYSLRKQGNFAAAIEEYSQAIALEPHHFKALFNRGFSWDKVLTSTLPCNVGRRTCTFGVPCVATLAEDACQSAALDHSLVWLGFDVVATKALRSIHSLICILVTPRSKA